MINAPALRSLVKGFITGRLKRGVTADGEPMPRKAASTIAQYRRKGWDTKHFLIRTGASTKLKSRVSGGRLYVGPMDPDTLHYNTDESNGRNTLTFVLAPHEQNEVVDFLKAEIAKRLKRNG